MEREYKGKRREMQPDEAEWLTQDPFWETYLEWCDETVVTYPADGGQPYLAPRAARPSLKDFQVWKEDQGYLGV
jgi:hypothetical protein